jgi:hypothetical protein
MIIFVPVPSQHITQNIQLMPLIFVEYAVSLHTGSEWQLCTQTTLFLQCCCSEMFTRTHPTFSCSYRTNSGAYAWGISLLDTLACAPLSTCLCWFVLWYYHSLANNPKLNNFCFRVSCWGMWQGKGWIFGVQVRHKLQGWLCVLVFHAANAVLRPFGRGRHSSASTDGC